PSLCEIISDGMGMGENPTGTAVGVVKCYRPLGKFKGGTACLIVIGNPIAGIVLAATLSTISMRQCIGRIDLYRSLFQDSGLFIGDLGALEPQRLRTKMKIIGLETGGMKASRPLAPSRLNTPAHRRGNGADEVVLQGEHLFQISVVPLGPDVLAAYGIDD